jgi:hypothetical protein
LQSVTYSDDYEGDFTSRRVLQYVLDFTMKTFFYGPIKQDTAIIKDAIVNVHSNNGGSQIEEVVNPLSAMQNDPHQIEHFIREIDF